MLFNMIMKDEGEEDVRISLHDPKEVSAFLLEVTKDLQDMPPETAVNITFEVTSQEAEAKPSIILLN